MTPERLREMVEAATEEQAALVPVNPEDLGYVQHTPALNDLEDMAPTLASLLAEAVEALEATLRNGGPIYDVTQARAFLSRFSEVEG